MKETFKGCWQRSFLYETLLYVFIVLLPVMTVPHLPLVKQKVQYSDMVFLLALSLWLVDVVRHKRDLCETPLRAPLAFMLVSFLPSFFYSGSLLGSAIEYLGIIYLAGLFYLLTQLVDSKDMWWRLVMCWCWVSGAIALTGIAAFSFSSMGVYQGPWVAQQDLYSYANQQLVSRLCSVFRHPAMLAVYLHASIVFGFILTVRKGPSPERLLGYAVVGLCFMAALLTKTRLNAGIAITVFLVLAMMPAKQIFSSVAKYISFLYALILSAVVVVLTIWWVFPVHFQKDPVRQTATIEVNTLYQPYFIQYKAAAQVFRDFPLVGVGMGMANTKKGDHIHWRDVERSYHVIYPDLKETDEATYKTGVDPHSMYLGAAAETGLLGLGGLLFFLSQVIFYFRKKTEEIDAEAKYIAGIFVAGLTGFLFNAFVMDMLTVRSFWFLMAMGVVFMKFGKSVTER